ncbi:GEVED domain-containing protein [Chryseobacterium wangxinyae]|uniref:GEVED domain-containing protein n=1 Tax=Chryseobacterium sp. CY353 TaxID=2997334 RepID=UPI002271CEE6|nr:GEVED domain-containing protein [Chryseobacterium sp. CY353]MCY0969236.1 GEVED domain-containing protein [Chryseobacterium sp. CY353]
MNKVLLTIIFFLAFIAKVYAQCAPVAVPFLQSFSSGALPNCWISQNPTTTSTSTYVKWRFSGAAGYGATGNGGRPAGTFAWVDASSPYANEHTVELLSPQINLTGLTNPYVKFEWFKNHLTSLTGTVPNYEHNQLKLEINSGSGWVQIWAGNTNDPEWRTVGVPLAASYVGATVRLKFTVDKDVLGNGYFYDDILLDEVQVIQAPTCFEPVTLPVTNVTPTSGTINWAAPLAPAPAPANGYEYYYSTTNTPPVAGTAGTFTAGTTADLTPLISGTTYYWWVRSVCSATDKSLWSEGIPFTPGQIGGGTATHAYLPAYSCSGFNYSQQIYTAAEVAGAVGNNNYITSIKFYVSTTATTQANYNQWVVYMGNTSQTDFATTTSWVPFSDLSQAYSGTLPAMTAGTWVTIPLTTPFLWDGTSNIVIAVDENSTGTSCTANWGSYPAGTNKGMLYYNSTTNPNPATPPTATSRYSVIPIIQMVGTALVPCVNTPPTNIAVSNISATSANVSWTPAAGATYVLRYRSLPGGTWTTVNLTTPLTNTYTIDGLLEFTQYEVEIATVCNTGPTGAFSTPTAFTTPGVSWCPHAAQYTSATYGWISNVTVNPIGSTPLNNTSAQSQYTNFSTNPALDLTLVRGTQNNIISVAKTWSGTQYANYTNVWIDYDRDGIFDSSELIYTSGSSAASPVSGTFNVPLVTYNGPNATRMRVVVSYASAAGACSGNTYGEVEDYAVRFVNPVPCTNAAPTNLTSTNITPVSAVLSWMPAQGATYVVQWRAVTTPAAVWITITPNPTVSSYTLTGLNEQVQYEFRVAYICNGIQGNFSVPVQFTTPAVSWCPHSAQYTSATYGWISNVTVNPVGSAILNNTSLQSQYTDFSGNPALELTLVRNTQNNLISVGKTWSGTQYANYTNVWIDFDRNGIFDTSELIYTSGSNATSPVSGTFSVPAVTYTGTSATRMRVVVSYAAAAGACSGNTYGEVEDYAVKFIDLQPCSTVAPIPVVSNMTSSTAYVSWIPTANATYRIRWRQGTTGVWQLQPLGYVELAAGQSFYTINNLLEQTAYQVQIQAKCGNNWGAFSASVNFTTPSLTYCSMTGTGTNDYISNVKVTPVNFPLMDNTSLQTNYISYTTPATLINLEVGSSGNQIAVSKAWIGTTYGDAIYAWIDWNRDGVFTDSERIMTSASSTTTPVTATFNVPSTGVYTGPYTTTMRVALKRGSAPVICVDPINGEVEDYAVKLRPCSNVTPTNVNVNPITHNSATVNWTSAANNNSFVVEYRAVTTPASNWTVINASSIGGNPPVQLTGLIPATEYEVRIAAVCGNSGTGNYTTVQTFTTRCDPTPPNVTITNVTSNSAVITWNPIVPNANYVLRWRAEGTIPWNTPAIPQPPSNSYTITGLNSYVSYEVQVANQCVGETTPNTWSNTQVFTTVRICEIAPPGLTITTLTPTSAEVVWDAFTGTGATSNYILRYRKVGIPSWTTTNVSTNTFTITGLLELTKYEMQVANVCSGNSGNFTPLYYFTTPTVIYCQVSSNNSTTEFISKVTAKPTNKPQMVNESNGSNYSDFTADPTKYIEMIQGSVGNSIIIDKTLANGANAGVAVWIDFNRNGYFDIDERILADGSNANPTASATFTVPADAFVSMTDYKYVVMRVAMQKDGIPVNCSNFNDGEVEDYTVKISKVPVVNSVNQNDILIYPNPVSTELNVKNISEKANYKIYSSSGRLISTGLIMNNKIDVTSLINGLYIIDIEDVKGAVQKKFIKQ